VFLREETAAGPDPAVAAAQLVARAAPTRGPVWAFGSEQVVYALNANPIVVPYFDRNEKYMNAYAACRGSPRTFVETLRGRGFEYVLFCWSDDVSAPPEVRASQPYADFVGTILPDDLASIAREPERLGLELLASGPGRIRGSPTTVRLYRIGNRAAATASTRSSAG
jgi:hypothetical protein